VNRHAPHRRLPDHAKPRPPALPRRGLPHKPRWTPRGWCPMSRSLCDAVLREVPVAGRRVWVWGRGAVLYAATRRLTPSSESVRRWQRGRGQESAREVGVMTQYSVLGTLSRYVRGSTFNSRVDVHYDNFEESPCIRSHPYTPITSSDVPSS